MENEEIDIGFGTDEPLGDWGTDFGTDRANREDLIGEIATEIREVSREYTMLFSKPGAFEALVRWLDKRVR
jgi:hypothetical protein